MDNSSTDPIPEQKRPFFFKAEVVISKPDGTPVFQTTFRPALWAGMWVLTLVAASLVRILLGL